ncbi:MAG TPA: right-handed parallel beta-helix repeat-containing protein [Planctomycetota bacterium]|jgi:hypothetical protein|nr:right-handed parallel beta-helix repeat-containing protein [Planctomycetota bacterium]OQC20927.1 MAG: hypothetical protein BWX69_01337 [Planctomycetes bacterium ADurb.Bin069]NMD35103.1 right-handed parallel beta-helix repeat-containing protein [Planctomycetota bacterium]HNR98423.1 right-handed parallel beta-helix repeat-containing protein [Planctomycetota bacterium]HNU25157.1 right-handed parallel beta-helix repeat-containing protein [Planctomycetota bacterium]
MPRLWMFAVCAAAFVVSSAADETTKADFFVATDGDDAWSGRLDAPNAAKTDGPFASVDKARQAVRELKAAAPGRAAPVVVLIRGGFYALPAALTFTPEDSGTEQAPVVYGSYGNERPVLSGGAALGPWQVTAEGRWQTTLQAVKNGAWTFSQLFVDDQRRFRPRLPGRGYHLIAAELPPSPQAAGKGHDRFAFAEADIDPNWANLVDVEILAFHQWSASRMRIAAVDPAARAVSFTGRTRSDGSWGRFLKGHRYLAINVKEALGEPGEWYLDRPSGVLTYVPMPGEDPSAATVIAPRLDCLVVFAGDGAARRWVRNIHLRGLTFAHSNWNLPPEGQSFPQAEIGLGAAIVAMGARDLVLDACAVRHTGGYAAAFGPGCRRNRVENCEFIDLGGGGIKIGHGGPGSWSDVGRQPEGEEALVSHHVVRNCLIAHGGRLHSAAVGVWVGHSPHNVLEHNDIFDFYYTGFSIGWVWGYGKSEAHHNDIGYNHVHTIGQGVLSDMGAIYTLGVSPGTRIHDNRFHDVLSFDYGGWGLYTDEGSSGIVMENNLVYRCSRGCFHQHYGRENIVRNNILAYGGEQQLQRTRTEEHISFFFERNIVLWDNRSPLLGSNWKDDNFRNDYNVYWNAAGAAVTFPGGLSLEEWRRTRNQDGHSVVADPLFRDPSRGDWGLKPESPALKLGFKPFDYTRAGRRGPAVLTRDCPPVPRGFE